MSTLPVKIGGLLYTKDSHRKPLYLLLKRTPQDGGFWQMITGTLHEGEDFLACLSREITEEVGLHDNFTIGQLVDHFTRHKSNGTLIHKFTYAVYVNKAFRPILSPQEHDDFVWLDYDTAMTTLYTENNKRSLTLLSRILNE